MHKKLFILLGLAVGINVMVILYGRIKVPAEQCAAVQDRMQ